MRLKAVEGGLVAGDPASSSPTNSATRFKPLAGMAAVGAGPWTERYLRMAKVADACCGLVAGLLAYHIRFDISGHHPAQYMAVSLALPFVWLLALALAGAYHVQFIGVGPDEFRRVLNAGVWLTAAVAIVAYASKVHLARRRRTDCCSPLRSMLNSRNAVS